MSRDVSKISQIILGYYNSKYNKNEKKMKKKSAEKTHINVIKKYQKIIIQDYDIKSKIIKLEKIKKKEEKKEEEMIKIKKEMNTVKGEETSKIDTDKKKTNIKELIKINNTELFNKIIYYRFLVIQKKIKIINLILLTYTATIINLCINEIDDDTIIINKNAENVEELKNDAILLETVLNNYLLNQVDNNEDNSELGKSLLELDKIIKFYHENNTNNENNK